MTVGIVGYGEVGSSLYRVYKGKNITPLVADHFQGKTDDMSQCEVVNICIPFTSLEKFIEQCEEYICHNTCRLVIIHSTIGIGTIEHLKKLYPEKSVVHSPVRGVHPNLYEGLLTFKKFIGTVEGDTKSGMDADNHLSSLGLVTEITTCNTTILAKLFSTSYYGICIAFTEDMGRICEQEGADFDKVIEWNRDYNRGYTVLGKGNVTRPILYRIPEGDKKIGGHCVVPNAVILKKMYPDEHIVDSILRYS